jgi:hypothetical protein
MPIKGKKISMPTYGGDNKRVGNNKAKKATKGDPSLYNVFGKPKRRLKVKDSEGKTKAVLKRGKATKGSSGKTEYPYSVKKKNA